MTLLGSKRARTTAYHPQANGMVERFHRQLKSALKTQPNPTAWMDSLPLILLGIRTALKEDISSTTAEMVYGTTLRLPGEFFTSTPTSSLPDPSDFVSRLKSYFQTVRPTASRPNQRPSHVSDALSTATHVFIRHDGVRKPLQPPYDGPFRVISRTDKHFTISIRGRNDTVSIDRLKPAHLDSFSFHAQHSNTTSHSSSTSSTSAHISPTTTPTSTCTTRSGRRVHFPTYLSHNV